MTIRKKQTSSRFKLVGIGRRVAMYKLGFRL